MRHVAIFCLLSAAGVSGQGVIGTFAGTDFLFPADPLPAASAPLGHVQDVVVDSAGNLYISDRDNHVVVRRTPDGGLTVVAGNGLGGFSGDGGAAVNASLRAPQGLVIDMLGNLYVADSVDHRVRRIDPAGFIANYAGTGKAGFSGDGPAKTNQLNEPRGLAVDAAGTLYIADASNHRIRRVSPDGTMTTLAGTGTPANTGDGGPAIAANLNTPTALATDTAGNLYVATIGAVRRIDPNLSISTVLTLPVPSGLVVDAQGMLLISDSFGSRVLRLGTDGSTTVVAGNGDFRFAGDGGPAADGSLNQPAGLAIDAAGALHIADRDNLRTRRVAGGLITTTAGNGNYRFAGDAGDAAGATLNQPTGVTTDGLGDVFIADFANNRVRKVTADGIINTVAGTGASGFSGDGQQATAATLSLPRDVAADTSGFYIADRDNNRVRKVDLAGLIRTVAGGGQAVGLDVRDGGPATSGVLRLPAAVAVDANGNIYVADTNNDRIRKITPDGSISTVAGGGESAGNQIPATNAALNAPQGVAVDAQGRIFLSDTDNGLIRMVQNGVITTIAGGGASRAENADPLDALIDSPRGLALDALGNLYFTEFNANRVRRIAGGRLATFAGMAGAGGYAGDGGPADQALLSGPVGLAFDLAGNLFIADSGNGRIRKVFATPPTVQVSPQTITFRATAGDRLTAPRLVSVFSPDLSGLPFAVTVANQSPWLTLFPKSGRTPVSLEIAADPSDLAPGEYRDTLRISTPTAIPSVTDVSVLFRVDPSGDPVPVVDPQLLSFAFVAGSGAKSRTVTVSNDGGQVVGFTARADNPGPVKWLSVTPNSGQATATGPVFLTVTADPSLLAEGTYTGTVTIDTPTRTIVVRVSTTVNRVEQRIRLSQSGLTLTGVAGGGVIPPQAFSVLNTGFGVMPWTATVEARSGSPVFLSLSPATGSSDADAAQVPSVNVTANGDGFLPGEYFNQIRVESPTALNSPQFLPVVLEILPPDRDPGPVIQPTELVFVGTAGTAPPSSKDLRVYNLLGGPLNYKSRSVVTEGPNWISYLQTEASVAADNPRRVVVQPSTADLPSGVLQGVLTFRFDDGRTRKVNLTYFVRPALEGPAAGLRAADAPCEAKELKPGLTVLGQDFEVAAGYPQGLIVNVFDDCGTPLAKGNVHVSFSNGDPPQSMERNEPGVWTTTWTPGTAPGLVTITIEAEAPDLGLSKSVPVTGGIRTARSSPRIYPGGIVNSADFAAGQPLAIGGTISIFGTDLAERTEQAMSLPLTPSLGGASVVVAGRELPLTYASESQINAILPYDLAPNSELQLLIVSGDRVSEPQRLVISAARPVIFETLRGPAIVDLQGRLIGADNPAHPGATILIFAQGLGALQQSVVPGTAPGAIPTVSPVRVRLDGVDAEVGYAGLAPDFPGLYQVNVRIPEAVPPGDSDLVLTVADQDSPRTRIAIQAR